MRTKRKEGERLYKLATSFRDLREFEKEFPLLVSAAELKNPDALFRLAVCYKMGEGVEQNFKEAIRFFNLAAERGHQEALQALAYYSELEAGGQKDSNETEYSPCLSEEKRDLYTFRGLINSIESNKINPSPGFVLNFLEELLKAKHGDKLAQLPKEEEKVRDSIIVMTTVSEQQKAALTKTLDQYIEQKSLLPVQFGEKREEWENEANTLREALDATVMPIVFIPIIGGYAGFFQTTADKDNEKESENGVINSVKQDCNPA